MLYAGIGENNPLIRQLALKAMEVRRCLRLPPCVVSHMTLFFIIPAEMGRTTTWKIFAFYLPQPFGVKLDDKKNQAAVGVEAEIHSPDSPIKVLVIPTDEELGIAQQTLEIVQQESASTVSH